MLNLDIELLRAFVSVADTGNFTVAGSALGASQSAMSVRIRKLEERLGATLLFRSPRSVRLTSYGVRFLDEARGLLELHDQVAANALGQNIKPRLSLGVSDHVAGGGLTDVLSVLGEHLPHRQLHVTVGLSDELYQGYARQQYDAVIIRHDDVTLPARTVFFEDLVWAASKQFVWKQAATLPLIALNSGCAVRRLATNALESQGIEWESVFSGTGVQAVQAATSAKFGVACLDRRNVPDDCEDVGLKYGLPELPRTRMVLFHQVSAQVDGNIASLIVEAFQKCQQSHPV